MNNILLQNFLLTGKFSYTPTFGRALSSQFLLLCTSVKYGSPPVAKKFQSVDLENTVRKVFITHF